MINPRDSQITLTREATARLLSISISTLDRLIAQRRIAHIRVGRRVLFRQEMLEEFLQKTVILAKE